MENTAASPPPGSGQPLEAARLALLARAAHGQTEPDALRLAVQQAVSGLGGLGGMVHLSGPLDGRELHLAVTAGLPGDADVEWQHLDRDQDVPPALALRDGTPVWRPTPPDGRGHLPAGTGMAAVPFARPGGGSTGVLSVVTAGPRPPTAEQQAFLGAVARWISEQRERPPARRHGRRQRRLTPQQAVDDALRVGTWEWDMRTDELSWDETLSLIVGMGPNPFEGRIETWQRMVRPEDRMMLVGRVEQALREGGEYGARYGVIRPDGTVCGVEAWGRILFDEDGEPIRLVGRLRETGETSAAMDWVGRALWHMSDGFIAVGADWRVLYANDRAERLLGTSPEIADRKLWDIPAIGVPGFEEQCRRAAADSTPTGLDLQLPADGRWYHLRLIPVPTGMAVYLTDITEKRRLEEERAAAERAAAERAARIGELTTALAEALTVEDVVSAVADRVLPLFGATGLTMHALAGEQVQAVRAVGYTPSFVGGLVSQHLPEDHPAKGALRDGAPRFISSPEQLRAEYPAAASFVLKGGKKAWAFLPLLVSGHPVGSCVVSFDHPRHLSGEERTLLIALSGLIAQTLERARLYDAEHSRAQALQRGLLPSTLPSLPAATAAAHYLPASAADTLGGDWYDVVPLSADRVALVIGDVMGHGLSEAATMGRLRTAVRTLAGLELPPDELFSHLNDTVSELGDDFYATCLYALYDPVSRVCTAACAGHPPPVVVHPDSSVHLPEVSVNPPLGAATPPFETTELTLPEGSLLVMYTDGFVESPQRDIDSGITQLRETLAGELGGAPGRSRAAGPDGLDRLCRTLASALLPAQEQTGDDAAVLVARLHATPHEDVALWTLPEGPLGARVAREHVRQQLADWHLDELVTTTELIASELVGNVARHARGPVRLRLLRSRTLICEVSDSSLTTPRIRRARETDEGGRGLQLVAALTQRWGTRYTADGKCIWTEQPLV